MILEINEQGRNHTTRRHCRKHRGKELLGADSAGIGLQQLQRSSTLPQQREQGEGDRSQRSLPHSASRRQCHLDWFRSTRTASKRAGIRHSAHHHARRTLRWHSSGRRRHWSVSCSVVPRHLLWHTILVSRQTGQAILL